MRDHDPRAGPDLVGERPLDLTGGDGIEAGGGVVQYEEPARVAERPSQPEALDLTAGQRGVAEARAVPVGQTPYEQVGARGTGRGPDRLRAGAGAGARAESDRPADRVPQQHRPVEGVPDLAAQRSGRHLPQGYPVQQHLARVGIGETAGHSGEQRLARARPAHHRHSGASGNDQADVVQDRRSTTHDPDVAQLQGAGTAWRQLGPAVPEYGQVQQGGGPPGGGTAADHGRQPAGHGAESRREACVPQRGEEFARTAYRSIGIRAADRAVVPPYTCHMRLPSAPSSGNCARMRPRSRSAVPAAAMVRAPDSASTRRPAVAICTCW